MAIIAPKTAQEMMKTFQNEAIDTQTLLRLYPACVVDMHDGQSAEVSLEWAEMKYGQITIKGFVIVFDFTPLQPHVKNQKKFFYDNFTDFEKAMYEALTLLA